jgi:hypothetical protein
MDCRDSHPADLYLAESRSLMTVLLFRLRGTEIHVTLAFMRITADWRQAVGHLMT